MGVLAELKKNDITARLAEEQEKIPADQHTEKNFLPPISHSDAACPCGNSRFWLDAYGTWRCFACEPPVAAAFVKDKRNHNPGNKTSQIDAGAIYGHQVGGLTILAVENPDGEIAFNPTLTQAERREQVENFEFWQWIDNRKKQAEENSPTDP